MDRFRQMIKSLTPQGYYPYISDTRSITPRISSALTGLELSRHIDRWLHYPWIKAGKDQGLAIFIQVSLYGNPLCSQAWDCHCALRHNGHIKAARLPLGLFAGVNLHRGAEAG